MNYSVIMVSYHTGAVLFHAISRVLSQQGLTELIVVDNGNPPEVVERLRANPQIKLLTGHGNIGFAKGCNLGVQHATGEYIVLLNPDCLPEANALAQLCEALAQRPDAIMSGCLLLNPDGSEQRGGRRQLLTPVTAVSESFGLHHFMRMKRLNEHETATPAEICEVPAISGACMCLRRADFEALRGMDESYFLHVEDLDLCWRIQQVGKKILFVPGARVVHLLSTSDAAPPLIEWYKAKGFMRYFHRHFTAQYPHPLLWLADAGILARFALKVIFPRRHNPAMAAYSKKLLLLLEARGKPPQQDLRGKTVALTGATSPLGVIITGQLLAAGAKVVAISRQEGFPIQADNLTWLKTDIGSPDFALEGADIAIHCAPLWTLPPALQPLSKAGVRRLVAFGSTSMFGKDTSSNQYEQNVVSQLREAETLITERCHALGITYTILRPTLIYGLGLDGNVSRMARAIKRFGWVPVLPPAQGLRQPVHAEDLAHAALKALLSDATTDNAYNVSGGETLSYRAMLERIFHTMEKTPRIVELQWLPLVLDVIGRLLHNSGVNGAMAERMNMDLAFPHDEALRDFGYTPRSFLSGGMADLTGPR